MRANRRPYDDCGISGPYRQFNRSHWPTEFERQPKKPAESDKLASAESEIQESEATTSTSSSMQTAAPPPIKLLEDVIPPQAASFKGKNKTRFKRKSKNKKLVKAKAN
ncbi:unnamed protein product [Arabidopsis halleri]